MATTSTEHHERPSDIDLSATTPQLGQSSTHPNPTTTSSSPPPTFPVTPHDVLEPERPLDKSIEPLQSEALLSPSLPPVISEFQSKTSSNPIESSHPCQEGLLDSQPIQASSISTAVTDSAPVVEQKDLKPNSTNSPLASPPVSSAANNNSRPTDPHAQSIDQVSIPETIQATCVNSADKPVSSATDIGGTSDAAAQTSVGIAAPDLNTSAVIAPTAQKDLPLSSVSNPLISSDLKNPPQAPTPPCSPPEEPAFPDTLLPPSVAPISQQDGSPRSPVATPPADHQRNQIETNTADLDEDEGHPDLSAVPNSSHPPEPISTVCSNSLSPLSDVPSGHSPRHVTEYPNDQPSPKSVFSPRTSPVSSKRLASPSMYENQSSSVQPTDDASTHVNGTRIEPNGQSAHKRPRLNDDFSFNSHTQPSNSQLNTSQTSLHPQSAQPNHPVNRSQSMKEGSALAPGAAGSRLTKDQHRFAISVTKQLKKHRLSAAFLNPVDPVKLKIPDYFHVVKHPMDLSTIETRLGKVGKPCHYRSVEEFVSDVQLVFNNCYLYNGPPDVSPYSRAALDLSIQFETQMKKMPPDEPSVSTLSSRSPSLAKPPPKSKQPTDTVTPPPPAPKRKNESPNVHSSTLHLNGNQKRRSTSPHLARKKSTKAVTLPASVPPDSEAYHANVARSASFIDPSSSQRARSETRDHSIDARHGHVTHSATEPATIPNTKAELKFCKDVLREVNKKVYEKFVWPFYEPVDIVKLAIPDYPKFVKRPMDLHTMKLKLDRGEYKNGAAFAEDFRLMLNNCFVFNPPGTVYHNSGRQLESLFEAKWAERPPETIPAPAPQPSESQLDPLQILQMQVARLEERLDVETSKNALLSTALASAGPGHSKKSLASRGSGQPKNLPNSNSATFASLPASSSASKNGKANGTGAAKPRQSHGGARRKSAASTTAASTNKRPSQFLDQVPPPRQFDQTDLGIPLYQPLPLESAPLPSAPVAPPVPPPPAANRRVSQHEYFEKIDYEQKKDLATQIQNAVEPMQSNAINLIRNSRPDLVAADGEEIELDIDALDDRTLYQLYQLVCAPLPPPSTKGKKAPKSAGANGKSKPGRKAGSGAPRKLAAAPNAAPFIPPMAQAPVAHNPDGSPVWAYPASQQAVNGHGNGAKPKMKKPRANPPGPKRKGLDELQEAARIKDLEEKLHAFQGVTDPQSHPYHSNGVPPMNPAVGPTLNAPPAGPVEYASSSSESESESDDDSD